MDKLTYEEEERALNFYALDFEEFLRENFQPGTMSVEHALNMLSWPTCDWDGIITTKLKHNSSSWPRGARFGGRLRATLGTAD